MVILPFFVWGIKMVHLTNISKQHGSQILFKKASLQILAGARIGLVGAKGTGKTTIWTSSPGRSLACGPEKVHGHPCTGQP
jgi:ATP-binding cassette, subfamily F, member 3